MNKFESITKPLTWFMTLLLVAFVSGCGGGSGSVLGGGSNIVNGFASAGPLDGSSVCAYAITGGTKGAQIGSCATTVAGSYSIDLGGYTGPVLFETMNGNYKDEATGATLNLAPVTLHSMLPNATGGNVSVAITPLTELVYQKIPGGVLSNADIQTVIQAVENSFGVTDIVNTMPVDVVNVGNATTTPKQQQYTLALATVSQYMATSATTLASSLGTIQASSGVGALLNQAMTTYVSGNTAFSGVTLSTMILSSVAVTPASAVVAVGGTQQYVATRTYSDASTAVVTTNASWTSGTGASIGLHSGIATGVAGSTTPVITASLGGQSGTAALTVSPLGCAVASE